jgi:hypothetical protein
MKRNMRLASALLGVGGVGMLFLSGALGLGIVTVIGMVMVIVSIVSGLVSTAIEEKRDALLLRSSSDDGLQQPTMDKSQLPPGAYTPGQGH